MLNYQRVLGLLRWKLGWKLGAAEPKGCMTGASKSWSTAPMGTGTWRELGHLCKWLKVLRVHNILKHNFKRLQAFLVRSQVLSTSVFLMFPLSSILPSIGHLHRTPSNWSHTKQLSGERSRPVRSSRCFLHPVVPSKTPFPPPTPKGLDENNAELEMLRGKPI